MTDKLVEIQEYEVTETEVKLVNKIKWKCENCGLTNSLKYIMLRGPNPPGLFYRHLMCDYCSTQALREEKLKESMR